MPRPRWDREKERESGERGGVGYWVSVRVWAGVYREHGWAGRLAEWASLLGRLARGSFSPFFVFSFVVSFFYLFSFLFLNHFKLLRHFIKMGLLHHNYLCNIRYKPNIFILMFENFYCLT